MLQTKLAQVCGDSEGVMLEGDSVNGKKLNHQEREEEQYAEYRMYQNKEI